ncbi:MAG: peptidoglycan DD-metalloendopeptidase family protein [Pseudomonadota bacterium]|nr:peptidoglycan DD-metalloendopeptidase family protein [Pseudomonadota bacterium]MEC8621024.1 peptidoglycan DD-metalloendopeptidase family protein [Pseudomonadota bacterium]
MPMPPLHKRLAAIVGLSLVLLFASGFIPEQPTDHSLTLTTPPPELESSQASGVSNAQAGALLPDAAANSVETWDPASPEKYVVNENAVVTSEMVKVGDSMALIFARRNFSASALYALTQTAHGETLTGIFPGARLTFESKNDQLTALTYEPGPLERVVFSREQDGSFISEEIFTEPEKVLTYKHGIISSNLFSTSQAIGLPDNLTMQLAQIFQWDIDFVLDIRPGDEFFALVEEQYLGGEFIGFGDILSARFVNQGRTFTAVRYTTENGVSDYFNAQGRSMRKAFLRAPVEFSRISSSFNLRRKHPLYKTVRPHRGIDYAAPPGTPILAAGDGRVEIASRTKPNGRYVVIKHGEQFVTKYLHLSKFARGIKPGKRVNQGQIIGYVGSTGYATGPHLHYEFLVNGVHQNPRTVSLPQAKPVNDQEISRFRDRTFENLLLLDHFNQQVALTSTSPRS